MITKITKKKKKKNVNELQDTLKKLKLKYQEMQKEYNDITSVASDKEIVEQLTTKKQEFDRLDALLKEKSECDNQENNNENTKPKISEEQVKQVKLDFFKFAKAWKERKQTCHEMIEEIWSDHKVKDVVHKKLDGACDEDTNVKWDDFKELFKSTSLFYMKHQQPLLKNKTLNKTKTKKSQSRGR